MEKNTFTLLTLIMFFFVACNSKNDCEDIDCFTPPSPLYIDLIDQATQVNVFESGMLDTTNIYVVDNDLISQRFDYIEESHLLEFDEITFTTGPVVYQMILRDDYIVSFKLDMRVKNENCCTFSELNDFKVINQTYDFDEQSMLAKIYIQLD